MKRAVYWLLPVFAVGLLLAGSWIPLKAWLAQQLLQQAWQASVADTRPQRPWPWADHWPVARLSLDQHGIDQVVLAGDSGHALAFAPGYNRLSARPGERGTIMISGHRDTHFAFLQAVANGDEILLQGIDAERFYRVTHTAVVDSRTTAVDLAGGPDQLLLVTCYPFDAMLAGGPLRYVVTAEPQTY